MTTAAPSAPPTPVPPNTVIYFPDPTLETAIRQALGKSTTGKLTAREMATLTTLSAPGRGISDGGVSVTVCQDKAGTDESVKVAAEWIRENITGGLNPPAISEGSTILQLST